MKSHKYIFTFLFLLSLVFFLAVFLSPDSNLHIIACDVGQGDATLITFKNIQILTDGGPDNKVLECLGKYIPFYDREIELVVLTHPEADHYTGLIEVFRRYKVDNFLYNKVDISSLGYQVLEKEVGGRGVKTIRPERGMKLRLGKIYLDILNPTGLETDEKITKLIKGSKLNTLSIVSLVSFGSFRALLTGDIPPEISDGISNNWSFGNVDYIKVPHHGSKNGLTEALLKAIMPKLAVISVGKDNSFGHPHKEILDLLAKYGVKILRTDQVGNIETISSGQGFFIRY